MQLHLTKPIAFFDLETTGVNTATDRIVELSILKVYPNGEKETLTQRVNPTIPIPNGASEVHGIYDKDVANEPTFKQIAESLVEFLTNCDLAGYNSNRFDVPLLVEEFYRAGVEFDVNNRRMVDVQTVFHKMEQRTLSAAYKFYCEKELVGAHGAEADIKATYEILQAQLDRYSELDNDINFLHEFSMQGNRVDLAGRFVYGDNKEIIFNFGKFKGQKAKDVFKNQPGYFNWMMQGEFPANTKMVLQQMKAELAES